MLGREVLSLLNERERKHKRKHTEKEIFWSLRLSLLLHLCLLQARFYNEISALVRVLMLAPVIASLMKKRVLVFTKQVINAQMTYYGSEWGLEAAFGRLIAR